MDAQPRREEGRGRDGRHRRIGTRASVLDLVVPLPLHAWKNVQIWSLVTPCLRRSRSSESCIARGRSDDG